MQQPISLSSQRVPWWLWPNVLSLDAPLVAVLWQEALARSFHINLLPGCHLALFVAVWVIYMLDRTIDSFAPAEVSRLSTRHAFYRRNRWLFLGFIIPAASVLGILLALSAVPAAVLMRGITLAILVVLYLLLFSTGGGRIARAIGWIGCAIAAVATWQLPFPPSSQMIFTSAVMLLMFGSVLNRSGARVVLPKEVICGYLFAIGCALNVSFFTMDLQGGFRSPEVLLLALLFALNCIAISGYERESDAAFDSSAIAQTWPGIMKVYPLLLLSAAALSGFVLIPRVDPSLLLFGLAMLLSLGLLAALHVFARHLRPDVSRVLADVALALPLILLFASSTPTRAKQTEGHFHRRHVTQAALTACR